ncbi:MAG TPA: D-alanyl-D-alanine carboxypeptidase/D-alanyl-D-alanine-endopeptidase [Gemmatimonadota bacterium]|nr:D-alanyl-D-alanine carboxypeptidase/D-alanyl-D-alanine-endopeptidase [Gemmatimonadota bacterium]
MRIHGLLPIVLALAACAPRASTAPLPGRTAPPPAAPTAQVPGGASAADADRLPGWLDAVVDGPLERAHWGIAVYDLTGDRWVARHAADRYFVPASNLKLVVSATAMERLGPDYRWRTSVYATAPLAPDGTLEGDLVLYGRGDPNLSGRHFDSMTFVFQALADSLAARGLTRVSGDLLADESLWDADHVRRDWAGYDLLWWYAAPVGALGFNDNAIDFAVQPASRVGAPPLVEGDPSSAFWTLENGATTGPPGAPHTFDLTRIPGTNRVIAYGVLPLDTPPRTEYFAVVDPAGWAGTIFREVLAARGIEVHGGVRTVSDPAASPVAAGDTVALAAWESPTLTRVVESINGRSQNWHAEQVLKTLGAEARGEGSWAAGLAVERATLAALGVDTTGFLLRDASGLSSANLVTPEGLVALLRAARAEPWAEAWLASLPVAAESGSLRRRFANTVGAGRVHAKTGYIENVYSLSGYLETMTGREYAFSVIVNQTGPGSSGATETIDRLVNALISGAAP